MGRRRSGFLPARLNRPSSAKRATAPAGSRGSGARAGGGTSVTSHCKIRDDILAAGRPSTRHRHRRRRRRRRSRCGSRPAPGGGGVSWCDGWSGAGVGARARACAWRTSRFMIRPVSPSFIGFMCLLRMLTPSTVTLPFLRSTLMTCVAAGGPNVENCVRGERARAQRGGRRREQLRCGAHLPYRALVRAGDHLHLVAGAERRNAHRERRGAAARDDARRADHEGRGGAQHEREREEEPEHHRWQRSVERGA